MIPSERLPEFFDAQHIYLNNPASGRIFAILMSRTNENSLQKLL